MMRVALILFIFLSGGLVSLALYLGDYSFLSLIPLGLSAVWILGIFRTWKWIPALGLFGIYAMVVDGLLFDAPLVLLIPGAFLALLAWDLSDFSFRLQLAAPGDESTALLRRHLLILSLVTLAGVALQGFALTVHMRFTFEWMALLLLFAAWGVGRIVSGLLRHSQQR